MEPPSAARRIRESADFGSWEPAHRSIYLRPRRSSNNCAVTEREWALLVHLAGVVLLFSGMAVAAAAHEGARRGKFPGEVAALLALTRSGVFLVAFGGLLIVGSGLWLIEVSGGLYSLGDGWIAGALGLLVLAFVLGALGDSGRSGRGGSRSRANHLPRRCARSLTTPSRVR